MFRKIERVAQLIFPCFRRVHMISLILPLNIFWCFAGKIWNYSQKKIHLELVQSHNLTLTSWTHLWLSWVPISSSQLRTCDQDENTAKKLKKIRWYIIFSSSNRIMHTNIYINIQNKIMKNISTPFLIIAPVVP